MAIDPHTDEIRATLMANIEMTRDGDLVGRKLDISEVSEGSFVWVFSRGQYRKVLVTKTGRKNIKTAYVTEGGLNQSHKIWNSYQANYGGMSDEQVAVTVRETLMRLGNVSYTEKYVQSETEQAINGLHSSPTDFAPVTEKSTGEFFAYEN